MLCSLLQNNNCEYSDKYSEYTVFYRENTDTEWNFIFLLIRHEYKTFTVHKLI